MALKRTARFYRKNKASYKKKLEKDKKYNARPKNKAKRAELGRKRYKDKKSGKNIKGKDYDHATNSYVSPSKNRGRTSGTPGDKRARGKNRRKKK